MKKELTITEQIWNRACLENGGDLPGIGDRALADLLLFHGLAMNGGIAHAIDVLDQNQLSASQAGYRYFGWDDFADLISTLSDLDEESIEGQYPTHPDMPAATDEGLFNKFLETYSTNPEDFRPI